MEMVPEYWKSEVSDVEETVRSMVKGEVSTLCKLCGTKLTNPALLQSGHEKGWL